MALMVVDIFGNRGGVQKCYWLGVLIFVFFVDRSEDEWFRHDVPERQHCRSAGSPHGGLWPLADLWTLVHCPWRGGLQSLSDLGMLAPVPLRGGLWSLADLHQRLSYVP